MEAIASSTIAATIAMTLSLACTVVDSDPPRRTFLSFRLDEYRACLDHRDLVTTRV